MKARNGNPNAQRLQLAAELRLHPRGRPSKIVSDPEQRAFIDELLPNMTFAQIEKACRERFGDERAACSSVIHRYWIAVVKPRVRAEIAKLENFPQQTLTEMRAGGGRPSNGRSILAVLNDSLPCTLGYKAQSDDAK